MSELAILGGSPVRSRPFPVWPQYLPADAQRLQQVLESRHWGGYPVPSRYCGEFASRFAELPGAKFGLCLANGTIALVAALQAAGIRFGDEVIVPAYTWDGTAAAVLFAGGIPVFADVDPDTYCLDVESARAAITPRTRALLPVHMGRDGGRGPLRGRHPGVRRCRSGYLLPGCGIGARGHHAPHTGPPSCPHGTGRRPRSSSRAASRCSPMSIRIPIAWMWNRRARPSRPAHGPSFLST